MFLSNNTSTTGRENRYYLSYERFVFFVYSILSVENPIKTHHFLKKNAFFSFGKYISTNSIETPAIYTVPKRLHSKSERSEHNIPSIRYYYLFAVHCPRFFYRTRVFVHIEHKQKTKNKKKNAKLSYRIVFRTNDVCHT